MKPIDCKDQFDAQKLDAQGVQYNDEGIELNPGSGVKLFNNRITFYIPKHLFDKYVKWYTEDQSLPYDFKQKNF